MIRRSDAKSKLATGLAIVAIVMILGFQNCAPGFVPNGELTANSLGSPSDFVCGSTLEETFSKTYWPVVTTTCAGCHIAGGLAPSAFAGSQLTAAFAGFQTATQVKILANGTNPIHGGGAGGEKNRAALTQAQTNYDACKAGPGPAVTGEITARTANVVIAASATAKIITINLDSQLELGSTNLGGAQLQFLIRTATVGAAPAYLISNPSLRTVSSNVQLKGFKTKINGVSDPTWTAFTRIERTINLGAQPMNGQTLNGNLSAGNGTFAVTAIQATDTIQFEFEILRTAP